MNDVEEGSLARLRPVVLGSNGRAGRVISELFSEVAVQTVAATRVELDINDYFEMRWQFERLEADLVINAAAWTDVDACQADPERAFQINTEGARQVARAAHVVGARLIHLSTDYVFDGRKGSPYNEKDEPAPLSVYGQSKLEGERAVVEEEPDALIVRTAWLFGGHRPDFVSRIVAAGREIAAGRSPGSAIPVVQGQVGSPTSVQDLALAIVALAEEPLSGTVHFACSGATDRVDFARAVLKLAGLSQVPVLPEPEQSMLPESEKPVRAPRPADSRLDTSRYASVTGLDTRSWRQALEEILEKREHADP